MIRNPSAKSGDAGAEGLIPGLGRSPGGGNGNLLQYTCLENPMNKRAWWAAVHGVAESATTEHSTTTGGESGERRGQRRKELQGEADLLDSTFVFLYCTSSAMNYSRHVPFIRSLDLIPCSVSILRVLVMSEFLLGFLFLWEVLCLSLIIAEVLRNLS